MTQETQYTNNNKDIITDCGMLNVLGCCRYDDHISVRACCFSPVTDISIEDFFNTPFSDLDKLRRPNRGEVLCKFKCDLQPVEVLEINFLRKCNIKCFNCVSAAPLNRESLSLVKNTMFRLFDKIIKEKAHFKKIRLDGSGEIFLIFKDLKKYLEMLSKDYVDEIIFATNATLLSEHTVEELRFLSEKTGVIYSFDISLDGITKETFEATRVGAHFEKVIKNIKNLSKYFDFQLSFTAKKTNLTDNPYDVLEFFKKLGSFYQTVRYDILDDEIKKLYLEKYRDLLSC